MSSASTDTPMHASCHCGAVRIVAPRLPTEINECQCTICRRYAAAWAYYNPAEVKVTIQDGGATSKYFWGDRDHSFDWCTKCGCVVYWWPDKEQKEPKMGLNTRMVDPDVIRSVTRKIDHEMLFVPVEGGKGVTHPEDKAKY